MSGRTSRNDLPARSCRPKLGEDLSFRQLLGDVRREQAKLLSSTLGIPLVFEEPFESGMIKLIDRENDALLAAVTGREQAGVLASRIAEMLERVDDDESGREGGGA